MRQIATVITSHGGWVGGIEAIISPEMYLQHKNWWNCCGRSVSNLCPNHLKKAFWASNEENSQDINLLEVKQIQIHIREVQTLKNTCHLTALWGFL